MKIELVNENSVIIYFSESIDLEVSYKIKKINLELSKIDGLIDIIISYTSILITYDIFKYDCNSIVKILEERLSSFLNNENKTINFDILEIPVYYGSCVGIDLERVSKLCNKSISEIIKIHSSKIYDVFAIGFLPAFAYLGEVHKDIFVKRLETPRKIVKKGSLAIANSQTAIYPQNSPGGWNIIGKTPIEIFDKDLDNFSLIDYSKRVKFVPISKSEFLNLGGEL